MVTETTGFFEGIDHFYINHLPSAILLTLLLLAIGIGLGKYLGPLLRDFFGKGTVNVNIEEERRDGDRHHGEKICIPDNCPDHKAEKERSIRNEAEIKLIWAQFGVLRTELMGKLGNIEDGTQQILLALVEKGQLRARDIKKGG